jgi:hypothetical protein
MGESHERHTENRMPLFVPLIIPSSALSAQSLAATLSTDSSREGFVKNTRLYLAVLLLASSTACSMRAPEWEISLVEAGNFRVNAPGHLQESLTAGPVRVGDTQSHVFTLHKGAYGYAVAYIDYPVAQLAQANPPDPLEAGMQRTLDSVNATLLAKQDISLDDVPGIDFRGEFLGGTEFTTPGLVFGRVYLRETRLFQLMVVADRERVNEAQPERFLDSFGWLDFGQENSEYAK